MRTAEIIRNTSETQIKLTLNLDGTGRCDVKNPLGFFDHLLRSFCKHGMFDLTGELKGDLHVDEHHLIEDTGITLGMCFAKALGDCAGIFRSSFSSTRWTKSSFCICGFWRKTLSFCDASLSNIPLVSMSPEGVQSSFQTDCFEDFWQGFVSSARCNLHLETLRGRSDHHKMEGLFKAAARAIRSAVEIDPRRNGEIPSTKGLIV